MTLVENIKFRIKKTIQQRFFYNEQLQSLVWKIYYTPNKKQNSVKISVGAEKHLNELRENGITLIHGFESVADYIEETYFSTIDNQNFAPKKRLCERIELGAREKATNTETYRISFQDPGLAPLIFNSDLCGIIYNYYQRQPYYREQPVIVKNAFVNNISESELGKLEISSKFHTDCYRQIAGMFLVKDLTINDTHLQYAIGSHKTISPHPWDRTKINDQEVLKQYKIFDAIGPKGTLILMDAGSGLHRGLHKKNTVRKIFHFGLTTGHYFPLSDTKISVDNWPELANHPLHVQQMMYKLISK